MPEASGFQQVPDSPDQTGGPSESTLGLDPALVAQVANELYAETWRLAGWSASSSEPAGGGEQEQDLAVFGRATAGAGFLADLPREMPCELPALVRAAPRVRAETSAAAGAAQFYFLPAAATAPSAPSPPRGFDVEAVRRDFPALHQRVHDKPLIWLDNAATTHKPQAVIDALARYYARENSNIHRGAHLLAERATTAFEEARRKVQGLLGAASAEEIVFTRGATEAINLVAQTWGRKYVGAGDEIVVTTLEHHSNLVPWQLLCEERGAVLRVVPLDDQGQVIVEEYEALLGPRTRLVALAHVSNVLGTVLPLEAMIARAHQEGARVLVDGAQAVAHFPVNVQALDADFYVFSGHKLFGPTGIGALYGKRALLEAMPPWQGGGTMIDTVTLEKTTFREPPARFEAGTPHVAGAVGLGVAIDYVSRLGLERIAAYGQELMEYATAALGDVPGLRQIGTAPGKVGALTFVLAGIAPEDLGAFLDRQGIAVRAGHHCAQPTLRRYGLTSAVRASLAFYNTAEEIDALVAALRRAQKAR